MSDVRDMLGLEAPVEGEKAEPKKKSKKNKSGPFMAKELQNLMDTWENQSSTLVPNLVIPSGFKNKRTVPATKESGNWQLVPIRSSARVNTMMLSKKPPHDDVDLLHWVKGDQGGDYRFAQKFAKPIRLLDYTEQEYENYLQDPNWTRAQTDRLFELCHLYDLRFIVIHDRFISESPSSQPTVKLEGQDEKKSEMKTLIKSQVKQENEEEISPSSSKTVEDLKDRFYAIQRRLLLVRNASDPDLKKNPHFQHTFDAQYETERKTQLARLFARKETDVEEIANLVLENRQLIATIKQVKEQLKERSKILKIARPKSILTEDKPVKVKRKPKPEPSIAPVIDGEMAEIPPDCFPHGMFPPRLDGVFLRSTQLAYVPNLPSKQAKYLEQEVTNLKKIRDLTVPTSVVCDMYDTLRFDIVTSFQLQKVVAEREHLRDQIRAAKGLPPLPGSSFAMPSGSMAPSYNVSKGGSTGAISPMPGGATPIPLKKKSSMGGETKRRSDSGAVDDRNPKRIKQK